MFAQLWVPTYSFLLSALNDLIGYDPSSGMSGVLRNIYVGLCIGPTPPFANSSVIGGVTEATYTGYARQEVVWFPPYIDVLGPYAITGANLQFRPTDSMTPNTITGLFLASALTAGTLLLGCQLATPVVLNDPTEAFTTAPVVQLFNGNQWGGPLVFA